MQKNRGENIAAGGDHRLSPPSFATRSSHLSVASTLSSLSDLPHPLRRLDQPSPCLVMTWPLSKARPKLILPTHLYSSLLISLISLLAGSTDTLPLDEVHSFKSLISPHHSSCRSRNAQLRSVDGVIRRYMSPLSRQCTLSAARSLLPGRRSPTTFSSSRCV